MKVKLSNVRLAFPELWEAKQFDGSGDFKFSATFLIPKDHPVLKELESAIKQVATAKWGAKAESILASIRGNNQKFCLRDGAEKPDYEGYQDQYFIRASNKVRPLVIDRDRTPLIAQDGRPYSGCYVNATITIFTYENKGKGIAASLGGVQFFRDGDAFKGGGTASEDDFEDLSVAEEEESLI